MPKIPIYHNITNCIDCPYFKWGKFQHGSVVSHHKCLKKDCNITTKNIPKWCPFLTCKDKIKRIINEYYRSFKIW